MKYPFLEFWDTNFKITMFFDVMSLLLVGGLLFLSSQLRTDNIQAKLFKRMCYCLIIAMAVELTVGAMMELEGTVIGIIYVFLFSVSEAVNLLLTFFWVLYAEYLMYQSRDHMIRWRKIYLIPVAVMLCIEIFCATLLEFGADRGFAYITSKVVYYLLLTLCGIYLLIPAVKICRYRKRTGRLLNFRITPFVLPILCGFAPAVRSMYFSQSLGFAVGIISLYFSMIDMWKYESRTEGYLNREYLHKLREYVVNGKKSYGSVLMVYTKGDKEQLSEIIKSEIPVGVEMVHLVGGRFLVFLQQSDKSITDAIGAMIQEDIEDYNHKHQNTYLEASCESVHRRRDESVTDFVDRAIGEI